jgi:hypothetical protein
MPLALKAREAREYDQHKVFGGLKCIIDTQISPDNPPEKVLLHWQDRYKAKIAQKAIAFVSSLERFLIFVDIALQACSIPSPSTCTSQKRPISPSRFSRQTDGTKVTSLRQSRKPSSSEP